MEIFLDCRRFVLYNKLSFSAVVTKMQPGTDHHCHCEEAVRPTWQSPGAMLASAAKISEWYQEIATSGLRPSSQ